MMVSANTILLKLCTKINIMKVIISLTSIPSRFDKLEKVLTALLAQTCHEIWLNIPLKYKRFPDWDGKIPACLLQLDSKIKVNMDCEDMGPATKFMGPVKHLDPEDLIVYLDDDTEYDPKLVTNLLKWHRYDPRSAWGLSGFDFESYFRGHFPRQHGVPVDVIEGYGSVIVKAGWLDEYSSDDGHMADDVIISNLLEKKGIKRKTIYTPECNLSQLKQFDYGFGPDALHNQIQGGHRENYKQVLETLTYKNKNYFDYKCS